MPEKSLKEAKCCGSCQKQMVVSRKLIRVFGLTLMIPVLFREVLVTKLGVAGEFASLFPMCIVTVLGMVKVARKVGPVKIESALIGVWLGYMSVICLLSPLLHNFGHVVLTPAFGLFQYSAPLLFAFFIYKASLSVAIRPANDIVLRLLCGFSVITALGALLQFYITPDLYGMISNRIYSDLTMTHVTRRAISFIASPQALGAFLALSFGLVSVCMEGRTLLKFSTYLLIMIAGLHTGSKAFIVVSLTYMYLRAHTFIKFILTVGFLLVLASSASEGLFIENETFARLVALPQQLLQISTYGTFLIWKSFIFYESTFVNFLIGHGVGVLSTASQSMFMYKILGGSAESFLVQLYFEAGILGVFLFLIFYLASVRRLNLQGNKRLSAICAAMLVNMAFTPAFYGFTLSTICYLILFYRKQPAQQAELDSQPAVPTLLPSAKGGFV